MHRAFAGAPDDVLAEFAVIAAQASLNSAEARAAARQVAEWHPVRQAMRRLRHAAVEEKLRAAAEGVPLPSCCGSDAQRRYLRSLYRWYNDSRFHGILPDMLPIRFSHRMRRRLGHLRPGPGTSHRRVAEIALNVDLMLRDNDGLREDTLLHEMAHAADYLRDGNLNHGRSWRRWAERVGCRPRACTDAEFQRRSARQATVTRVPPLPLGARLRFPAS